MIEVVMCQTNLEYLKLLVHRFPTKTHEAIHWNFFVEDRFSERSHYGYKLPTAEKFMNEVQEILRGHPAFSTYDIWKSSEVLASVQNYLGLSGESLSFLYEYKTSLKLTVPIFMFTTAAHGQSDRFLFMDDDILILRDPTVFYRQYSSIIQNKFVDRYKSGFEPPYFHEANRVLGTNVTAEQWNQKNSNGVLIFERNDYTNWADVCKATFESPLWLEEFRYYRERQHEHSTCRLFFIDMFLQCFKAISLNAHLTDRTEVQNWITRPKESPDVLAQRLAKSQKRKVFPIFIHYACGKGKQLYVDTFKSPVLDQLFREIQNGER